MDGILGMGPLDAMLGEVPDHSRILVSCAPDMDGRALLLQAARQALRNDQDVVYVVTARPPSAIRRALDRVGQKDLTRLHFIDAYSGRLGAPQDRPLPSAADIAGLVATLDDLADDLPDAHLFIESVSSLAEKAPDDLKRHGKELLDVMHRYEATMALHVDWPELPDISRFLSKFDGGLHFYGIEQTIVRNNALKVDHLAWQKKVDDRPRFIRILQDGGIRVLVPKVVVTGPSDAGKTTFINTVTHDASGTERGNTTVALDKGHYKHGGIETQLFGTPGQKRFDPIINTLLEQASAAILLVDATDPASFDRADELLERIKRRGLHVIVAANKQDLDGAASIDDLQGRFGVDVLPCTAEDPDSARTVLTAILDRALMEVPS